MKNNKEAFKEYLKFEKKYSHHTIEAYLSDVIAFELFVNQEFDVTNLLEVRYDYIRSWIISLVDNGLTNTSVNRKIASLKSFYKFLLKQSK